jgi:hypothetical protein
MTHTKIYFVITCGRSGSTSLARILDTATNGRCLVEPVPNLCIETRDMMEGRLANPREVLVKQVLPRVAEVLDQGDIYGEKSLNLGPFIPHLYEMLKCKFVLLIRDGRDVVTSFINWHNEVYGSVYRECKEPVSLSKLAREVTTRVPVEKDIANYSRPRPSPSDPFYDEWPTFSRFEMVAWYWAYISRLFINNLSQIPKQDWTTVNYTGIGASDVGHIFDFLGLEGFDQNRVESMIQSRINSVEDGANALAHRIGDDPKHRSRIRSRLVRKMLSHFGFIQSRSKTPRSSIWEQWNEGHRPRFPTWQHWSEDYRQRFDRIASETMRLLGYYN